MAGALSGTLRTATAASGPSSRPSLRPSGLAVAGSRLLYSSNLVVGRRGAVGMATTWAATPTAIITVMGAIAAETA